MRVSVSSIDTYIYYRDSEDAELDELLRRLRGEEPPTPEMAMGTALHGILEDATAGMELDDVERDGFRFVFDLDSELALPPVRECKGEMELDVDGTPVTLVGKVDGLDGVRVWDHKLTGRFDAERFANNTQWKLYLWMFGGRKFTYNVFTRYEKDDYVLIREFHPLNFYAYPGMEDDNMRALREYVAFATEHLEAT